MDIAALEQALRKAFQANPNLALAGAAGLVDVELPAEFARAAKNLNHQVDRGSLLSRIRENSQIWV